MPTVIVAVEADAATTITAGWNDYVEENNLVRGPEIIKTAAHLVYNTLANEAIVDYINSPEGRVRLEKYDWVAHPVARELCAGIINSPTTNLTAIISQMCYAVAGDRADLLCDVIISDMLNEMTLPEYDDDEDDEDGAVGMGEDHFGVSWPLLRAIRNGWDVTADEELIEIFACAITDFCVGILSETVQWGEIESLAKAAKTLETWAGVAETAVITDRVIIGTF